MPKLTRAEYLRLPRHAQLDAEEEAWPPTPPEPPPAPPPPKATAEAYPAPYVLAGARGPRPWWGARVRRTSDGATVGVGAGPTRAAALADAWASVVETSGRARA